MDLFTNGVGRPSNETIKKRNIFKGICFVFGLIIIGLVGCILNDKGIINLNSNKSNNGDNKEIVDTTKRVKENMLSESEVNNLFNKYNLFTNWLNIYKAEGFDKKNSRIVDDYSYFYSKNITKNTVSDEMKFAVSIGNLYIKKTVEKNAFGEEYNYTFLDVYESDMQTPKKIKLNDLNDESLRLFGSRINMENLIDKNNVVDIAIMGNEFKYNKDNTIESIGGGIGDSSSEDYFTKIISFNENNNKLVIINKIFFKSCLAGDDYCNITNNISGIITKIENNVSSDEVFNKYSDKLNTFKWTFDKANEGNYIFESVEKIN